MGREPPDKLVPLPRATKGTSILWQRRTVSMTSASLTGKTTAPGLVLNAVKASDS